MRPGAWFVVPAALAALIGGCASSAPVMPASQAEVKLDAYQLGVGDSLRITVFDEPTLNGQYRVTDTGDIAFPLIGNVAAGGRSLAEVQTALRTRLGAGYITDPRVSVEVVEYGPYYILGEVGRPGEYPFKYGLSLTQAVAAAGGYSFRASQGQAFLRRRGDDVEYRVSLKGPPVRVMPGDTIRIGERVF